MNDLKELDCGLREKISKKWMNYGGLLVSVLLVFAIVLIATTDIREVTLQDVANLGIEFFILLFATWGVYVCCSDSGTRSGELTDIYVNTVRAFEELSDKITKSNMHTMMSAYCRHVIAEELQDARMRFLAPAGLSYVVYEQKYVHLDRKTIRAIPELTKGQKKAIRKANRIKPIRLTPERIMYQGRRAQRRNPLGIHPTSEKYIGFGAKLVQMSVISLCASVIAFDVIANPSWSMVVGVVMKLASVVYNGFGGYRSGFKNISVDNVEYMKTQMRFMQQGIQYAEAHKASE